MTTSADRTTLAPSRVLALTKGQTAVRVEGVLKFRFDTSTDEVCAFYSKYGLQSSAYGDFGFTAATAKADATTPPPSHEGWHQFLAQAHADTMKQVVHDSSRRPSTRLDVQNDLEIQKCLILAKAHLNREPRHGGAPATARGSGSRRSSRAPAAATA